MANEKRWCVELLLERSCFVNRYGPGRVSDMSLPPSNMGQPGDDTRITVQRRRAVPTGCARRSGAPVELHRRVWADGHGSKQLAMSLAEFHERLAAIAARACTESGGVRGALLRRSLSFMRRFDAAARRAFDLDADEEWTQARQKIWTHLRWISLRVKLDTNATKSGERV